ncbi:hypothetical protein AAVH_33365 [Aphelenchoides avenae]|nr:hypothetical protein AAVH_33365 [Aphelenchus avenae]
MFCAAVFFVLSFVAVHAQKKTSCEHTSADGIVSALVNDAGCHYEVLGDVIRVNMLAITNMDPYKIGVYLQRSHDEELQDLGEYGEGIRVSAHNCAEPPNFEIGTATCVLAFTGFATKSGFASFTVEPKSGCNYLRKEINDTNRDRARVGAPIFSFSVNKEKPIEEQRDFDFFLWDFDADGDGKMADFFVRNTKQVHCDEYRLNMSPALRLIL